MSRRKEFDMTEVLDKATDYFWQHGYEGTSIQDLVQHLGVKAQSLYNAYGGKRDLFLASLRNYVRQSTVISTLEQTASGKEAIVKVFRDLLDDLARSECKKGCFMFNTSVELAPHDPEIAEFIEKERTRSELAYYQALLRAKEQGDIPKRHSDLMALARYLHNAQGGLTVTAKTVSDPSVLEDIAKVTLSIFD
ncbi:TetR/AcrR family transcriptional regulator [Cohnella sp. REN36]|uniref:TetR/AcrR family transcriptional regulator n=1 Tax=Cohnella sp. REN36 TaxID=2887347 RepID=UPI001D157576|nr:TetR/AcrR family transcriptional regulator [Cohnella sp. REN36]MCC3375087.1 TetR/AcrR family transcriptional regulator [Cohnella sp. REN36]